MVLYRIIAAVCEFFPPGGPDGQWQTVYTGTSVGHKHIAVFDRPVTATAVRLVVDSSRAVPCISRFSVYPALQ